MKITTLLSVCACMHLAGCATAPPPSGVSPASTARVMDSDGDRVPDAADQCAGSHPQQAIGPDGCPVMTHYGFTHSWVNFDSGSAWLRPDSEAILSEFAHFVIAHPQPFELVGHADSCGSPEANVRLSLARARAVQARLIALGVTPSLIAKVLGVGSTDLLEETSPDGSCASERSRRVNFLDAR